MSNKHHFFQLQFAASAFCTLLAVAPFPTHSQTDRILGSKGDWQVVRTSGSFDDGGSSCIVRTNNEIEGGRRKRPRVRLNLRDSKLFVDPDVHLSGIIMAVAVIEDRTQRHQPARPLLHRMRVDNNEIIEAKIPDPRYGRWEVHASVPDFADFVVQLGDGQRLLYEWSLGRGHKFYEFELAGFRVMKKLLQTHSDCVKGN